MEKKKIIFIVFRQYEQGHLLENELQIQIWMDATLRELTQLINNVNPDGRRGKQFDFSIVTADDSHNYYYLKDIENSKNGKQQSDAQIQLGHKRFYIGDYLDVAISYKSQQQISPSINHYVTEFFNNYQKRLINGVVVEMDLFDQFHEMITVIVHSNCFITVSVFETTSKKTIDFKCCAAEK